MQSGDKWNEIKDESWDGYLEDKTFADQKGAAVDFKPTEFADLGALRSEILALQDKESGHVNSIAALTPQRSAAEGNLSAANSAYGNFNAMEDSEFVDNDESRFNIEQKGLSLNQRASALGLFLSDSPLYPIEGFYQDILGRKSDPEGKKYWQQKFDEGMSLTDIQEQFLRSDEYKTERIKRLFTVPKPFL
jgi:hypothetical protein